MEKAIKMIKKTALITGGAGGLGKELAEHLMNEGVSVVVLDKISHKDLDYKYRYRLNKYIKLDLSDLQAVKNSIEEGLIADLPQIDILIINAFPKVFKEFQDFKENEIIDFVNSAFTNQLILVNYFLNKMTENNFGRIIIISSKSGIQGYSLGSLYCSLKAAWITFHESIGKELKTSKKNVTITNVCPDSLSDQLGNRYYQYEFIAGTIKKNVQKAIFSDRSGISFPATFKTKLMLSLQLFRKFLKLW